MRNIQLIDFFTLKQKSSAGFVKFVRDNLVEINQRWEIEYGGTIGVKDSALYFDDNYVLLCVMQEYSGECELFHFYKATEQMKHKTVEYLEIELILGLWRKGIG